MTTDLTIHSATPAPDERRDPVELLESQAVTRAADLVPVRYGRMLTSPFAFYRGGALLMATDLSMRPNSGLTVQLCGDAHLSNFGVYGSAERRLVFDLNDFDETHPGPFEWDVKRLAASLEIACRHNGLDDDQRAEIVTVSARSYRDAMQGFAAMSPLDVWYAGVDIERIIKSVKHDQGKGMAKRLEKFIAKAKTRDASQAVAKLTEVVDGRRRIASAPPLVVPARDLLGEEQAEAFKEVLATLLDDYRQSLADDRKLLLGRYEMMDIAHKVVGVGSVGTRAWIVLLRATDTGDLLFLQAKQAESSVLERYLGSSAYANHGERVVQGQRLMQAASDIFLGWQRGTGFDGQERDHYLRQLRDWKGSAEIEKMRPEGLARYAELCGWTLARAHARSGDRVGIANHLGETSGFEDAIATFAAAYADLNDLDYAALASAVESGRVAAQHGV